jgi:hypothetical protein
MPVHISEARSMDARLGTHPMRETKPPAVKLTQAFIASAVPLSALKQWPLNSSAVTGLLNK